MRSHSLAIAALMGCAGIWPTGFAKSAAPAVNIPVGSNISPSAALSYYGNPVSPAAPATRDPLVQEIARALRYDVDLIFEHARDNVEFLPMFGLKKGARGVVLDNYGTAFDQAHFLVETLREADAVASKGYNPAYILGTINLSGAEFASWTGISDAAMAAKLLNNGGIPATVTGSGGSFTVAMLHVWVRVTIGGTNYLFDPSLKGLTPIAGLNWQAATGYSEATALAAGGGTVTSTSISGFSQAGFRAQLDAYRSNLEAYLAANAAGKRAEAVMGDDVIIPHPSSENRRTSLPYVDGGQSQWVWAGQIPDVFRTRFSVSLNGSSTLDHFADEASGKVLGFTYNRNGSTFSLSGMLPGSNVSGYFLDPCDEWQSNLPAIATPAIVSVAINHPYAAGGGSYVDRTIQRQIAQQQCGYGRFYVSNDWGYTGTGITQRIAPAAARISAGPTIEFVFAPTLANVASQHSAFLDMAGRTQGAVFQLHDLVGIHALDLVYTAIDSGPQTQYNMSTSLSMSYESAISTFSKTGSAGDAPAAFTAALSLSFAEGAVPRQETDAVYDMAALNLFTQQDVRATTPGTYTTYLATPATWGSVQSSLQEYPASSSSAISGYIGEGYSVLVPQKGALRQPRITFVNTNPAVTRTGSLWEGASALSTPVELKRSAFFAWDPPPVGNVPEKIALVLYDQRRGSIMKAGTGVAVATGPSVGNPIQRPEAPKAASVNLVRNAIRIDGKTGTLTYSPPPDLVDGNGAFPRSLSLQRVYDQRDQTNYGLGMGWKTNWYHVATFSNDGQAALGRSGAQAAASALVALQAYGSLTATQDPQHLYAAAHVAAWLADQTINNVVTLTRGFDGDHTFYRQADGSYANGRPDGAKLEQSGAPIEGIINRRLYTTPLLTYTDAAGSIRTYPSIANSPGQDLTSPGIAALFARKTSYLRDWDFPDGVKIKAVYGSTGIANVVIFLERVYNNLGSAIYRQGYDPGLATDRPYCATQGGFVVLEPARDAFIEYRTATALVKFTMAGQVGYEYFEPDPPWRCPPGKTTPDNVYKYNPWSHLLASRDPSMETWRYDYAGAEGMFGPVPGLSLIQKPSSTSADIRIAYGNDSNARTLTNLRNNVWNYFSSRNRSEALTPVQAATTGIGAVTYFDPYGQAIRSIDPLQRVTLTAYDDLGRPTQVTKPEGDATVSGYDVRGNVTQETRKAKPGTGLPDLVTSTAYVTGPTTPSCATPATCNKPAHVIDARGYRTSYDWDSATGNLLSSVQGLNAAGTGCQITGGVCPTTTLSYTSSLAGYDPYNAVSWGSLKLLSGKTELIESGVTTTTAYEYELRDFSPLNYQPMTANPVKRVLPVRVIVDSGLGSLNLRSCYAYDGAGNIIGETEPKAVSCP